MGPEVIEHEQAEKLLYLQRDILESIAVGASLDDVLDSLCRLIEQMVPKSVTSVMLLDNTAKRLRLYAAPSVPDTARKLLDGIVPAEGAGSCGTAVHRGEPIFVCDALLDRAWAEARDIALALGIKACWSMPIGYRSGEILGTFAITSFNERRPSSFDRCILDAASHLAGIAIQRKCKDDALRASEKRLQDITDTVPGAVYQFRRSRNSEPRFTFVSRGMEELWGLSRAQILDDFRLAWARVLPEDREALAESIRHSAETLTAWTQEFRITMPDGDVKWVQASAIPEREPYDDATVWNGLVSDVTAQKTTERRLRQAAIAFESTMEGVMITDANGRIIDVNRAFSDITGYTPTEAVGEFPGRLLRSQRHDKSCYQSIWPQLKDDGQWQGEVWNRRKNGTVYPEWLSITAVRDADGTVSNYVGVSADISSMKESEERLLHLAHHDALTGLPNRLLFDGRLEHSLHRARRSRRHVALLFLDLDRFKNINDSLGHGAGDDLLKQVARRLSKRVRENDTVARLSGDEFTIILEEMEDSKDAILVARAILEDFSKPFQLQGGDYFVTASIGISLHPNDGDNVQTLLKNADVAMYRAKELGRNNYCHYTPELTAVVQEWIVLENNLRRALERDELEVYYQPQVSAHDGQVIGAEALVRWHHPDIGIVSPGRFIPVAEDTGMIGPIGEWVLREACRQAKVWQDEGAASFRISVNLSDRQIIHTFVEDQLVPILRETGLNPGTLVLEITEGSVMQDAERSIAVLSAIKALGVSLAIDDFGTGYSSLSYLKRLPIQGVKIDQSLVRDIPADPNDEAIARAVIAMSRTLNLTVTAEGVETEEQSDVLRNEGCDEFQGFLYSQPVPADELARLLNEGAGPARVVQ